MNTHQAKKLYHYHTFDFLLIILKENQEIPEDYFVFWGIEDAKLFEFAKKDITKLASGEKPFNMEITTIDTHTPDGYLCDQCKNTHKNQYANVIECQSKQIMTLLIGVKRKNGMKIQQ